MNETELKELITENLEIKHISLSFLEDIENLFKNINELETKKVLS